MNMEFSIGSYIDKDLDKKIAFEQPLSELITQFISTILKIRKKCLKNSQEKKLSRLILKTR